MITTADWTFGETFVQGHKHSAHNASIQRSPYEAMFGCTVKVGLTSTSMPAEVTGNLHNEDLLALVAPNQVSDNKESSQQPTSTSTHLHTFTHIYIYAACHPGTHPASHADWTASPRRRCHTCSASDLFCNNDRRPPEYPWTDLMSQSRQRSVQNISRRRCFERTFLQESLSAVSTETTYRSRCVKQLPNSHGVGDNDSQNAIVEPKGVKPIGVSALRQK